MKVGILDFADGGNLYSIKKSLDRLDCDTEVVRSFDGIDKLVIPGVGAFSDAAEAIEPFREEIKEFSKSNHVLGICLGMQLLCNKGFEFGEHDGLGLLEGECVKINTNLPLPHIGWNGLSAIRDSRLLRGLEESSFYFMHSYEVINYTDSVALSGYGNHRFVSVVENGNVFGVQFHPEKSGESGLKLFENFIGA